MRRHIPFEGTPNFRDLGGYQAQDGRQLKWNCFYRSGHLSRFSARDLNEFASLGVRVVCDFRRAEEVERDPSVLPEHARPQLLQLAIDPGSATGFFARVRRWRTAEEDMARFMCDINRAFALDHHGPYRRMLEAIFHLRDGAMLFHCAAGKDRTGFAAALILMIMNVPREVILQDYMLTNDYFSPEVELQLLADKYANFGLDKLAPEAVRPIFEVRPEYLQSAFDAIDEHYASTEDYLEAVFELTPAKRQQLQQRFLV